MDRLLRKLAGCGLVVLLAAPGCHQGMNRVPPGRPYNSDGRQTPPIDFGSDPKPQTNMNTQALGVQPGTLPGQAYGAQSNSYTPTNAPRFGTPTDGGAYGPPGTAGTTSPYLAGAGAGAGGVTSGTPLMSSGASDPRTTPPLGGLPGGAPMTDPGLGAAGLTPGASSSPGGSLP